MKSDNNLAGSSHADNKNEATKSNNYGNELNSGDVGYGGGDNGASTLRAMRKKHTSATSVNRRKPLL